jgi:hypothetical protein
MDKNINRFRFKVISNSPREKLKFICLMLCKSLLLSKNLPNDRSP